MLVCITGLGGMFGMKWKYYCVTFYCTSTKLQHSVHEFNILGDKVPIDRRFFNFCATEII